MRWSTPWSRPRPASARFGPLGELLGPLLAGALLGVVAGFLVLAVVAAGQRLIGRKSH